MDFSYPMHDLYSIPKKSDLSVVQVRLFPRYTNPDCPVHFTEYNLILYQAVATAETFNNSGYRKRSRINFSKQRR